MASMIWRTGQIRGLPRDLRQVVNDMNHRLRYAGGEYDSPPPPMPPP
jgi:hypothetical protein